jgi:Protein of unknown function (DUF3987)
MVAQFINQPLQIDTTEFFAHLEALGYKRGDKACIRYINPSTSKAIKADGLDFKQMEKLQGEGFNVYVVVNPGGHSDQDIKQGKAIFYEHDNLDKSSQINLWESLGLPKPSFQVDTGGKSVHSYWVLADHLDVGTWLRLQSDLLDHANADRTIRNASRVMRLAGSLYINKSGEPVGSARIISNSGCTYTTEELRAIIPTVLPPITNYRSADAHGGSQLPITNHHTSDIPLYQCLSKADRDLIDHGSGEGQRNDSGAKLARNLIGTANRLTHLGYRFEEDPRSLFDAYCSHCSPPLDAREADLIWKSASNDNPTATLSDDALENCIKSWQRQQQQGIKTDTGSTPKKNVVAHPTAKILEIDFKSIKTEYLKLLSKDASQSEVELFKIQTRQNYPLLQPSELNRFLDATENEFNKAESLLSDAEELQKLIDASEQTINLADYLPPSLAIPLSQYREWQKIRPAVVLTSLLTSMSSLHKVGTELVLHKNLNFTVPPTLYSAIVAESGSKKSPIFRATAKLPLNKMKQSRLDEYLENLKDYQSELEAWEEEKSNLKKGEKPTTPKPTEPPKPPIFYFTDATGEGIKAQAQSAPDKALFALVDELAGYFGSQDAYRGGKGADKQDLLSYYDGTGATVLRAGGVKVDIARIYLSILGTIQPDVVKKIMGNTNDVDGGWARFLFAIQPNIPTTLPDDVPCGVDCTEVITAYFEKVFELPATTYELSREAFKIYQPFYNRLEQLRVSHPTPGLRAVYAKAEGLAGRLALNLHDLHELAEGRTPSEVIGVEMMEKAISLMKFYIGQVRLIHAQINDSDSVAPHIHKVIDLSKRKQLCGEEGWIKASDVQKNTTRAKRPVASEAREWMIQASNLGYGVLKGEGTKIEFKSLLQNSIDKIDRNRQTIDTVSIPESIDIEGIQKTIDRIDKIDDYKKVHTPLEDIPQPITNRQEIDTPRLLCLSNPESIDVESNPAIDNPSIVASTDCLLSIGEMVESANIADIVVIAEGQEAIATRTLQASQPSHPQYKVGDRIRCYPTYDHAQNNWKVTATITEIEYQQGYLHHCQVKYLDKKHGEQLAVIGGGSSDWIFGRV